MLLAIGICHLMSYSFALHSHDLAALIKESNAYKNLASAFFKLED